VIPPVQKRPAIFLFGEPHFAFAFILDVGRDRRTGENPKQCFAENIFHAI